MSPRPVKFKFCLDENFPAMAGKFLRTLGHNAKYNHRINRSASSLSDLQQIKEAIKLQGILISLDHDFTVNRHLLGMIRKSPGVVLIVSSDPVDLNIIRILKRQIKYLSANKLKGKTCRISADKIIYK